MDNVLGLEKNTWDTIVGMLKDDNKNNVSVLIERGL